MAEKVSLEIEVNAAQARAEIRGMDKEMKGLADEAKALAPSTVAVKNTLSGLSQELKANSQMARLFGSSSEGLRSQQNAIKNAARDLIDRGLAPESIELQNLKTQYQATSDELKEFELNQKQATEGTASLEEKLSSLAQSGAALMALNKIKDFGANAVKSYANVEAAATRLDVALELHGMKEAKAGFVALAASLQNVAGVDRDLVTQLEAELVAQGRTEEQTKKTIMAATALSVATGADLAGSVKQLAKTYSGLAGEMGESIPDMRTLTQEQLKAGAAIDLINNKYGSFIGRTGTTQIALNRAAQSVGDVTEAIGQGLAPIVSEAANILSGLASAIASVSPEVKILGAIVLTVLMGAMTGLVIRTLAVTAAKWGLFGAEMAVNSAMAVGNPLLWAGIAAAAAAVVATGLLVSSKMREARATDDAADSLNRYTAAARSARDIVNDFGKYAGLFGGKAMSFEPIDKQDPASLRNYITLLQNAKADLDKEYEKANAGPATTGKNGFVPNYRGKSAETIKAEIGSVSSELTNAQNRLASLYADGMEAIKGVTSGTQTELQKLQVQINEISKFSPANDADKALKEQAIAILAAKRQELRDANTKAFTDFGSTLNVAPIALAEQKMAALAAATLEYEGNLSKAEDLGKTAGASSQEIAAVKLKALAVYTAAQLRAVNDYALKEREIQASLTESQIDDLELQRDRELLAFAGTEEQKAQLAAQWAAKITQTEADEAKNAAAARIAAIREAFEEQKRLAAESGNWGKFAGAEFQSQAKGTDVGRMFGFAGGESEDPMAVLLQAAIQLALSFESVQDALNFVQTFVEDVKPILDPLVSDAIKPLLDNMKDLAEPFAQILAPFITLIALVFRLNPYFAMLKIGAQVVGDIFLWLNDKIIVPFGNAVIGIANALIRGINSFLDDAGLGKYKIKQIALLQTTAQFADQAAQTADAQKKINDAMDDLRDVFQEKTESLKKEYDKNIEAMTNLLELGVVSETEYDSRVRAYTAAYESTMESLTLEHERQIEELQNLSDALADGTITVANALASLAKVLAGGSAAIPTRGIKIGTDGRIIEDGEIGLKPAGSSQTIADAIQRQNTQPSGSTTFNISILGDVATEDGIADSIATRIQRRLSRGQYEVAR